MRSLRIMGLVVGFVLIYGAIATAVPVDYFNYQNYGGTWSDAEKSPLNSQDDYMCWAAAAANVLQWTGWGNVAGLKTSDDIFSYYVNHWTNAGGLMQYGWEWWFNGTNDMQGYKGWSQVDAPGGDFYPTSNFSSYLSVESNPRLAMTAIKNYLQAGDGVGIGIYTRTGGHALTVWGIKYDSVTNQPLGIWVTDSDDSAAQTNPADLLQYYAVNSVGGKYYLKNFYGTTNSWYIGEVEGLARMPVAAPVTNWTAGTDAWETGGNWDHGLPTSVAIARVDNDGTAQITSSASAKELDLGFTGSGNALLLGGSLNLADSMIIGSGSGSSGTFTMNSGSFISKTVYVGQGGNGTFNHGGGTAAISNALNLGSATGSIGAYNLQSGTLQAPTEVIGNYGSGIFNQTGGTNTVGTLLSIGTATGSGAYIIGGGTLNAKSVTVGSLGQFNITSSSASIRLTGNLTFSDGAHFNAVAGSKIVIAGGNVNVSMLSAGDMAGLANIEFVFDGGTRAVTQFSLLDDSTFRIGGSFSLGKFTLGDTTGAGLVKLIDIYNTGFFKIYGADSLSLTSLLINTGSYFDLDGFTLTLPGDYAATLDSWIADRRLRDTFIGSSAYLDAVYDPTNSWTVVQAYLRKGRGAAGQTLRGNQANLSLHGLSGMSPIGSVEGNELTSVPEPGTVAMVVCALLGLAGTAFRRMRS